MSGSLTPSLDDPGQSSDGDGVRAKRPLSIPGGFPLPPPRGVLGLLIAHYQKANSQSARNAHEHQSRYQHDQQPYPDVETHIRRLQINLPSRVGPCSASTAFFREPTSQSLAKEADRNHATTVDETFPDGNQRGRVDTKRPLYMQVSRRETQRRERESRAKALEIQCGATIRAQRNVAQIYCDETFGKPLARCQADRRIKTSSTCDWRFSSARQRCSCALSRRAQPRLPRAPMRLDPRVPASVSSRV